MNRQFFAHILPGTILCKRYRMIECLFASEDGGIYLCQHVRRRSEYFAVKVYRNKADAFGYLRDRLIREFRLTQMVQHQNVLSSGHLFEDEDFVAFTMPFLPGGSLAERLGNDSQRSGSDIIFVLYQLACGVSALHDAGIFHRDLKPENILFDADGTLKIADLGIGTVIRKQSLFEKEYMVGTSQYWAPEYIVDGQFDERSDIFALGVIGYELLAGATPPSEDVMVNGTKIRVCRTGLEDVPLPEHFPAQLRRLIQRCLHSDPSRRFQTAHNLARILAVANVWAESEEVCVEAASFRCPERIERSSISTLDLTLRISREAFCDSIREAS